MISIFRHDTDTLLTLMTQINRTSTEFDEDTIYETELALVPFWFRTLVLIALAILGIVGVLLNGFVIGCFAFCPIVSKIIIFNSKPKYIVDKNQH